MATYYYDGSLATGANDGSSWANAFQTFAAAIAGMTSAGDILYMASDGTENVAGHVSYTINSSSTPANPQRFICVDKTSGAPPTTLQTMQAGGGYIGHTSSSFYIGIRGVGFFYGVKFRIAGSSGVRIMLCESGANQYQMYESCRFLIGSASAAAGSTIGSASSGHESVTLTRNCEWEWGNTSQVIALYGRWESYNDSFSVGTTHAAKVIGISSSNASARITGGNMSNSDTIVGGSGINSSLPVELYACRLKSGFALLDQTTNGPTEGFVTAFDCSVGDTHLDFMHQTGAGTLTLDTSIYADTHSWKLVTSAAVSYLLPYWSPWMHAYNATTGSAITPKIEVVRSGNSSAYNDDELWGEWTYKSTSGFSIVSHVTDRKLLLSSAAAQETGDLGASDWTGESATSWFGKLSPGAITPQEVGYLSARVAVGVASSTVYIHPRVYPLDL